MWFEPIEDDDDEEAGPRIMVSLCVFQNLQRHETCCQEGASERRGTLRGNEQIPTFSEYGSTSDAGALASQSSKGPQSP